MVSCLKHAFLCCGTVFGLGACDELRFGEPDESITNPAIVVQESSQQPVVAGGGLSVLVQGYGGQCLALSVAGGAFSVSDGQRHTDTQYVPIEEGRITNVLVVPDDVEAELTLSLFTSVAEDPQTQAITCTGLLTSRIFPAQSKTPRSSSNEADASGDSSNDAAIEEDGQ